jgi:nitroreductase
MEVFDAIRSRRSVGRLDGDVDEVQIRELIELATWAPNHRLTEPWRFTVVRGAARERLGSIWASAAAADLTLTGEARDAALQREAGKTLRAPVIIVASTRTDSDTVVAEEDLAATAAAVENLLLAAAARGLGAMWRTGDMARNREVKAFLSLDPSDRIVAFIYLGRASGEAPPPKPREVDGVIRWLA